MGETKEQARFAWRITAVHVSTYMIVGLLASTLMDYESWWATEPLAYLRPLDSPWVTAGPSLQVTRGFVLAVVLWPIRDRILRGPRGWLALWGLLAGIGIVSTYGATPGSIEGWIYTDWPAAYHLFGLPELLLQSLTFSLCVVGWYRRPHRAWGWVLGTLAVLTMLASGVGTLLTLA